MHSTFMGVEMGKRGVAVHQTAIQTTGHNITNLNTDGYSRQRVKIGTVDPLYSPGLSRPNTPGQLGQGPTVARVERIFDVLHETQVLSASDDLGYWSARDQYIEKLEMIYNEPNEVSVRTFMDQFWNSWQDLAENPEQLSSRAGVVQKGQALSEAINYRSGALQEQRMLLNDEIKITVSDINQKTNAIAALNTQITQVKAMGDEPNDFMDRRDLLVRELAMLLPISVHHQDNGEFRVHVKGHILVQGELAHPLSTFDDPANDSLATVRWGQADAPHWRDTPNDDYLAGNGRLASLIELRDVDVLDEMNKLDAITIHFIDVVNDLHRAGAGRNGESGVAFFRQNNIVENATGSIDRNGDGQLDSTYLFRISGANRVEPTQQVGLAGVITLSGPRGSRIEVPYNPADTVSDIVARINYSGAEVVARVDSQGQLSLKGSLASDPAAENFVVRYVADSGQFLVGYAGLLNQSGEVGAFNYENADAGETALRMERGASYQTTPLRRPAAWIAVNERISSDLNFVAASKPMASGEMAVGDNNMALAIANVRHEKVMIDRLTSLDDFFADSAAIIGSKGQEARDTHQAFMSISKGLDDIRQSISGVNINEEFADLVKFQHGFSASARFISICDQMLDTIVNRLKV